MGSRRPDRPGRAGQARAGPAVPSGHRTGDASGTRSAEDGPVDDEHRTAPPARTRGAPPDLTASRYRIDDIDGQLIELLAERARIVADVVRYKRSRRMRVVDRAREDRMLEAIGNRASAAGLDPRIARQVLRAVIDGFTLLEVEELGPDLEDD